MHTLSILRFIGTTFIAAFVFFGPTQLLAERDSGVEALRSGSTAGHHKGEICDVDIKRPPLKTKTERDKGDLCDNVQNFPRLNAERDPGDNAGPENPQPWMTTERDPGENAGPDNPQPWLTTERDPGENAGPDNPQPWLRTERDPGDNAGPDTRQPWLNA
ncbi:hypothetical protein [Roseovarius confluentis]|uniref:hypothetical protein n=1 Tax=Roseovarius confluentis TaxID=1852027 RepID=UPI003BA98F9B